MKPIIYILSIIFLGTLICHAQEINIVPYLKQIESGDNDKAKEDLEQLKSNYPDDPSVIFLDAVLTENGDEAQRKYETVYKKYPKSKFADAALYRVFAYYYSLGIYKKAENLLNKLKSAYPNSPYIKTADRTIPDEEEVIYGESEFLDNNTGEYKYTVQAGAFLNIDNAKDLQKKLQQGGYYTEINSKRVGASTLKVVTAGRFKTENEAKTLLNYLREKHALNGRIVPSNKN